LNLPGLLPNPDEPASLGNLRRLLWLRNLMILAALLLLIAAHHWVASPLPWSWLILALTLYAATGISIVRQLRQWREPSEHDLAVQIFIDILAMTVVLALAGGASSPFAFTYLLPITIGATLLNTRRSWAIVSIAIAAYSLLIIFRPPDPAAFAHNHGMNRFDLHVFGMWGGFVFSALLIASFVHGMRAALLRQQLALAQAREARARDEQLVSLGTLAASTAHELGTPLGSIALLADELGDDALTADERSESLAALRQQVQRCKSALAGLSKAAGQTQAQSGQLLPVINWLTALRDEWQQRRPDTPLVSDWQGPKDAPPLLAERSLGYAVLNLLDNAADASPELVRWEAHWSNTELHMQIIDRGPGLSAAARVNLRQPGNSSKPQGLGLGLFLAHAVIERLGGNVQLGEADGGGLAVHIHLPLLGDKA
jgi:two-component system sensor histidine kinase RegB